MMTLPGYQILEHLHESQRCMVFRAIDAHDQQPVILKVFQNPLPLPREIAHFKREFAIAARFDHPNIARAKALIQIDKLWVFVMHDSQGQSLRKYLHGKNSSLESGIAAIDLPTFFAIAQQLCEAVAVIHRHNVIHKDLNPDNLIWNPQTQVLEVIDFCISSELSQETPSIQSPTVLEGTLRYMAPEQTGRMNRVLDYRADFYAMGATFYEMLAGRSLFDADDAMELVHCHMARPPDWSHPTLQALPVKLITVLQRLLEKNAEQRYQTIQGLIRDLKLCQSLVQNLNDAHDPSDKTSDHFGLFQIPQKLYGREKEIAQLMAAFERVSNGQCELMLVAGYSGIGKSALINEIHKPIVARRGYFVSGKFDQYQRNIPYSSLIQALQELIRQLLTEPRNQVETCAAKLKLALGANAGVMVELIPELQLILGTTEPVVDLPPVEAEHRLNRLFQHFVQVFAAATHPLVIFLDDLQWADQPTLKLIDLFMRGEEGNYLFFLGAYRDNEVDAAHPLMLMCDKLKSHHVHLHTLILAPLNIDDATRLVADTLHESEELCRPLAQLCSRKTQGNPFFLSQFLKAIYEAGYVTYHFEHERWQWDMARLENAGFTDNVVELMVAKIGHLPPETQDLLQLAASIGDRFNLATLALVSGQSPYITQQHLWFALQDGLIRPLDGQYKYLNEDDTVATIATIDYRFLHDRMQQAAYLNVDDAQKQTRHLQIGRILYRQAIGQTEAQISQQHNDIDDDLFAIVAQYNSGRALIDDPAERLLLAELNLRAGRKAKLSVAYHAAFNLLQIGMNLLPADAWQHQHQLALALHVEAAEAAYLSGEFAAAEAIYPLIMPNCITVKEKISCYLVQMRQYRSQLRYLEAIVIQRAGLLLLDIDIPEDNDTLLKMRDERLVQVRGLSAGLSIDAIKSAGEMTGQEQLFQMQLLEGLMYSSYFSGQVSLNMVATLTMTSLSLQYGNSDLSSLAYLFYAMGGMHALKNYTAGHEIGLMAVELANSRSSLQVRGIVSLLFASYINHWSRHLATSEPYFNNAYVNAFKSGDFFTVGYLLAMSTIERLMRGEHLPDLLRKAEQDKLILRRYGQIDMLDSMQVGVVQSINNLMGITNSNDSDKDICEADFVRTYANAPQHLCYLYHAKMRDSYLFDSPDATIWADKLQLVTTLTLYQSQTSDATFYAALILIRVLQRNKVRLDVEREKFLVLQDKLRGWAKQCPENQAAKYALVQAEAARECENNMAAMGFYQEAIDRARETDYINLQALANELYGAFWISIHQPRVAQVFLSEALYLYRIWGAEGKANALQRLHPSLVITPSLSGTTMRQATTTISSYDALDLASVMKATQALTSEVTLKNVLERMIVIAKENAGAQTARLLLQQGGVWLLEAAASGSELQVLQSQLIDLEAHDSALFPCALLRYVLRSGKEIVEEDLTTSASFGSDPYVRKQRPKSVMCLPIKRLSQVIGIIYLENNLAVGSFTQERVEFLRVLAVQSIISIGNARLYENLERQVAERTAQLSASNHNLHQANEGLAQSLTALHQAQAQLVQQEKMASLGALVAGVAHEINTPLGTTLMAISGAAGAWQRLQAATATGSISKSVLAANTEEGIEYTNLALRTATRVASLITAFKTITVHTDSDRSMELDLTTYLSEVATLVYAPLTQGGHQLEIEVTPGLTLHTVPEALTEALARILANVFDHAFADGGGDGGGGGGILRICAQAGAQCQTEEGCDVVITVSDNGAGIAAEDLPKVFDPFFTTKSGIGGHIGLGLHVAFNHITQRLGGSIGIDSTVDQGTKVTICLKT